MRDREKVLKAKEYAKKQREIIKQSQAKKAQAVEFEHMPMKKEIVHHHQEAI
jgi:hypothetical protein